MQEIEILIQKLFEGSCTETELKTIFSHLAANPDLSSPEIKEELMIHMQEIPPLAKERSKDIFDKVQAGISLPTPKESNVFIPQEKKIKRFVWNRSLTIAASFLFLSGLVAWFVWGQENLQVIQTKAGQIVEITLPDSSQVTLNGNTQLSYAKNWSGETSRVVLLEGEAYFHVRKKPATQAKFLVKTPALTVAVLGTIFNVNSRKSQTEVFLEEGKVSIQVENDKNQELALKPGELLSYVEQQTEELKAYKTSPGLHTSWKTGVLELNKIPLEEVIEKIAAANGVEILIADSDLANKKLTTGLPIDDLDLTFQVLEKMLNLNIERESGKIIITKKDY